MKSGNNGFSDGCVYLIDCYEITHQDLVDNVDKHCIDDIGIVKYKRIYAWILADPVVKKRFGVFNFGFRELNPKFIMSRFN